MRIAISAVLAASLCAAAPAFAADDSRDQGPLAPGGAAGVQAAQDIGLPMIIAVVGVVGAAAAVTILVSNGNGSSATTTSGKP